MEPHRGSYPEDSGSHWYRGEQQYGEPEGQARYGAHADESGYQAQERRGGGRVPPAAPPPMGQWAGDPRLSVPTEVPSPDAAQYWDPAMTGETHRAVGRPPAAPAGAAARGGTRQPRRFATGVAIGIAIALSALPVLRILLDSASGEALSASGVISSVLVLLGLALGGPGLYGLAAGAARAADAPAPHAWLRPPLAYLAVALVLFVAAGLAAG